MIVISKFLKEHFVSCTCALGLTILGCLGYRTVWWIINKCQGTKKIDQVGKKTIGNQQSSAHFSQFPINRVSNLEISFDKITMGQGEYVVFHKSATGEKQQLSPETFEQVYQVLLQHSPAALVNSGPEKTAIKKCANRYESLRTKLKEIDPTLEAVFVPKTLYELIFIRKCIQEDLKHKKVCPSLTPSSHDNEHESFVIYKGKKMEKRKRCWHLCYFTDVGNNDHAGVKSVAYRLNKAICKAFGPTSKGFTYQELFDFAEQEIQMLKNHYVNNLHLMKELKEGKKVEIIGDPTTPGPTTNFGVETTKQAVKPMGIRNDADAQIIRNAIALECSTIAQHSFLLYKGADFQKDSTSCWSNQDKPYSLSYGSSLFVGCLYDGGATAFYYMRKGKNAYAISVPFDQLNNSPFFIPPTHTVAQLFGDGEIFHARTKAWDNYNVEKIEGINIIGINSDKRDHLKSTLSKEELNTQFQRYKNMAFQLKE